MRDDDLLLFAAQNGIIDLGVIRDQVEDMEREKLLNQHTAKIWQDNAGRWSTYIKTDTGRKLIKKQNKKDLEDALVQYYKGAKEKHYIYDICLEWLQQRLEYGEIEKQTEMRYKTEASRLFKQPSIIDKDIDEITEWELEDFIKSTIKSEGLTSKGWNAFKYLLISSFRFAKKKGYTDDSRRSFFDDLEISKKTLVRKRTTKPQVFTDTEVNEIYEHIFHTNGDIINLGIAFAIQTGLRVGELSALKKDDLQGCLLNVTRTEIKLKEEGKGTTYKVRECTKGKEGSRQVILTEHAIEIFNQIKNLSGGNEYLFESADGSRIAGKVFTYRLYRICDKLKIPRRSMHKCRKTYATRMINKGLSEKIIQEQMGHVSIQTTKDYYYYNNLETEKAIMLVQRAMGEY